MAVERTYIGDTAYFPDLGRWLEPGETVEFDEAPDAGDTRFATPSQAAKRGSELRKAKANAEPAPEAPANSEES